METTEKNQYELITKIDDQWYTCHFWTDSRGVFYVRHTNKKGNIITLCSPIGDKYEHSEHLAKLMLKQIVN